MPSDVHGAAVEAKSRGLWWQARGPSRSRSIHAPAMLLGVPVLLVVWFLALPLLAIFLKVLTQAELWKTLQQPLVTQALWLSLVTSCSSLLLAVFCGTPVAYLLARHRFRSAVLLDTLIDLPGVPHGRRGGLLRRSVGEVSSGHGSTPWRADWLHHGGSGLSPVREHAVLFAPRTLVRASIGVGACRLYIGPFRHADISAGDGAPGLPGPAQRCSDGVGAPWGIRRHHHVRRQSPRPHTDDATGDLSRRVRPHCGTGTLRHLDSCPLWWALLYALAPASRDIRCLCLRSGCKNLLTAFGWT